MTQQDNIRRPRSPLEMLKWLIFEPVLLRRYSDSLKKNKKQARKDFLRACLYMAFFAIILWLGLNLAIAILDLPSIFPVLFREEIVDHWNDYSGWFSSFIFYSAQTIGLMAVGLTLGLGFGLARNLDYGLAVGLFVCLVFDLGFGLGFGLA
ncbi:MAG: hypothetical protein L0Y73_07425, partial [Candidatus Aminicenantes bacterium]|nr:hypothetical protein [Candidatus Aminicenantes bacterium]